ncbi:hypothetical protein pdam_00009447 [Pocillopora damicornis]|uniref:Uncharacterized protein n=1 Tax=Pocillopora damicornis TaxID=46731 RepID=A0A3M6TGC0_POCDA|nr:hypothetical protein pdam_00009447 [Pocillopora damicornis]
MDRLLITIGRCEFGKRQAILISQPGRKLFGSALRTARIYLDHVAKVSNLREDRLHGREKRVCWKLVSPIVSKILGNFRLGGRRTLLLRPPLPPVPPPMLSYSSRLIPLDQTPQVILVSRIALLPSRWREGSGKRKKKDPVNERKGQPYCHNPCYASEFGPGGFGHGGTESHKY